MDIKKHVFCLVSVVTIFAVTVMPCFASKSEIYLDLPEPFPFNIEHNQPTEEAYKKIDALLQGSYNAYIMDDPLNSMWIDIDNSDLQLSYHSTTDYDDYDYEATGILGEIVGYSEFKNPSQMVKLVDDFVDSFPVYGNTVYEKVKYIHDYLCNRITYKSVSYSHCAYGALINKKAVCEGYAESFMLLCRKNGIECILVSGFANNGSYAEHHMWNYVRMDDNKWYAVDVTWDDATSIAYTYFLVGNKTTVARKEKFEVNHVPSADVSYDQCFEFELPKLSDNAYKVNNPSLVGPNASTYKPKSNTYYYDQLDKNQKTFYKALKNVQAPSGVNISVIVDTDDFVSVTPETTSKPLVTQPSTTKAPVTQPSTTKAPVTQPSTTKAPVTQPVTTQPVVTQPVVTQPVVTQPVATQPIVTQPVVTKPATSKPIVTQPATSASATDPVTQVSPISSDVPSSGYPYETTGSDPSETSVPPVSEEADTSSGSAEGSGGSKVNPLIIAGAAVVFAAAIVIGILVGRLSKK